MPPQPSDLIDEGRFRQNAAVNEIDRGQQRRAVEVCIATAAGEGDIVVRAVAAYPRCVDAALSRMPPELLETTVGLPGARRGWKRGRNSATTAFTSLTASTDDEDD